MIIDYFLERRMTESIEKARKDTEWRIRNASVNSLDDILAKSINENFDRINFSYQKKKKNAAFVYVNDVEIEHITNTLKEHDYGKFALGSSFIIAGQPLLKKRFVMAGSARGTSIASKYLSRILPQKTSTRILGTRVLGRALGRAVPYVGWALLTIDVIEIIIEYSSKKTKENKTGFSRGFGGGSFGGAGARGSW